MASLENSQGRNNRVVSRTANVSASNDPQTQYTDAQKLRAGAEVLAAAKTLGMDEDTLFAWMNSRRELGSTRRNGLETGDIHISPSQKLAQLTNTLAELPSSEPDGARTVSNEEADLLLAGGEKTQDTIQNFGGFDPETGRQKDYEAGAKELANARRETRDLNAFSVSTRIPGTKPAQYRQKDVYIDDGRPTPPSFRENAMYRDAGITRGRYIDTTEQMVDVRTPRNKKGRRLEGAISQEKRKRANYDVDYSGDHVRPTATVSPAPADALERVLQKVDAGELEMDQVIRVIDEGKPTQRNETVGDLVERLRKNSPRFEEENGTMIDVTQRAQVRAERERGAAEVRKDSARFDAIKAIKNQLAYESEYDALVNGVGQNPNARQGSRNITLLGETPLPGGLTAAKSTTDAYFSAAQSALSAEAMRRRPEAVVDSRFGVFTPETSDYADFYGFSQYVDAGSGEAVPTATTGEAVNAPGRELTGTQQFIVDHAFEPKGQDAQLQQANISQAQADWARGVEAHAPGYRHKPVTSIEELELQIGRVIEARQKAGHNFYLKEKGPKGIIRNKKIENPGIAEVLQLFRMGPQDQENLANAILQQELGRANAVTGPQPVISSRNADFDTGTQNPQRPQVTTGTMFGAEDINLTRARDSQAARFGGITGEEVRDDEGRLVREAMDPSDLKDAQMPFIASQGKRETPRTRMVTKDPATGRARTPDQAVAAYKAQRKKNKKPVDPVYAEKIRRDNAGLRSDQAKLEENQAVDRVIRKAAASPFNVQGSTDIGEQRENRAATASQYEFDGGGRGKPPTAIASPAAAPEPNNNTSAVSRALKREIAARVDQKRRGRREAIGIGAGVGAGVAGIGALLSALNDSYNGPREEQF